LNQKALIERIDVLKKSETIMRTERQKLEKKARYMIYKSLIVKGAGI